MNIYEQTFRILKPGETMEIGDYSINDYREMLPIQPGQGGLYRVTLHGLYLRPIDSLAISSKPDFSKTI